MVDVNKRTRQAYYGPDASKSTVTGTRGDTYHATDSGILYFWNEPLASWDNGHKQRVRCLGRGFTDFGVVAPVAWTRFGQTLYRGSDLEGVPSNIKFYLQTTGPGTVTVRMQDVTNAATIGSLAGLSGALALYDLGALLNVTAAFAEWETQVLPSGGGITVVMGGTNIFSD